MENIPTPSLYASRSQIIHHVLLSILLYNQHRNGPSGCHRRPLSTSRELLQSQQTNIAKEENKQKFNSGTQISVSPLFRTVSEEKPRRRRTHLSFVIINKPCTRNPFMICGAMPLNNPPTPSCCMIYFITSMKLLKGRPPLPGGGRD